MSEKKSRIPKQFRFADQINGKLLHYSTSLEMSQTEIIERLIRDYLGQEFVTQLLAERKKQAKTALRKGSNGPFERLLAPFSGNAIEALVPA